MSTESLYQEKTGVSFRAPVHPFPTEASAPRARSIVASLGAALDSSRFKKALFAASLAAAALYYVSILTIALLF